MILLTKEQIDDLLDNVIGVEKRNGWKGDSQQFTCPIHGESHPSCGITVGMTSDYGEEKQLFHCFSCGAKGSIPYLLYESMDEFKSIKKAEEFIADRFSISYDASKKVLSRRSLRRVESDMRTPIKKLKVLNRSVLAPFRSGKTTYKYFFTRGFTKQDMVYWSIGRDVENRTVTIPAFFEDGSLAGVIGRYIDPRPKNMRFMVYGFEKGSLIFPENKLKVTDNTIIGVESMFDCMALHKWGFKNTVSIMGNQMTREQADYISRHCSRFIGLWDNDEGGEKAHEIAKKHLKGKVDYLSCDYSGVCGKDPLEWGEKSTERILSTASLFTTTILRRI